MRILILYHAGFTYTAAIFDYLDAFRRHSLHEVAFCNIDDPDGSVDFSGYDCLFVNFCVTSIARIEPPAYFSRLLIALARFRGPKIVSVQDEYDFTDRVQAFISEIGASVVLTNVPQGHIDAVYREQQQEGVLFETVQTSYLSDDLVRSGLTAKPLAERSIPLGYRGRELPYRLGDLGWHKSEIGRRFAAACAARGIACDIAVDEKSRFQGPDWLDFVRRCRVMLGTQSGANVFDFDGSLHEAMTRRYHAAPGLKYEDIRDEVEARAIGFDMGQVSARIFEAVASRTALALVRGAYSGVLEPEEHYVPIEPDYLNVDEVLDRILDLNAMQAMADRAWRHVVGNPANHYAAMVEAVDRIASTMCAPASPSPQVCNSPSVTAAPLGADPYLVGKLFEVRRQIATADEMLAEVLRLAADGRLEVVRHFDGTFRVLKFERAAAAN